MAGLTACPARPCVARGWPGVSVACRSRRAVQLRLWLTPDRPARVAPGKMGGHKLSATSGEHRLWVLQRTKSGDFTLRGLVAEAG